MIPFTRLTKFFLGGTVGSGNQYISWIHVEDFNELVHWVISREEISGTYNATGPSPVPNRNFMWELRRVYDRPWSPPVPSFLVRFGARWVMQTEGDLALGGRRCIPGKLQKLGFTFKYPRLGDALDASR